MCEDGDDVRVVMMPLPQAVKAELDHPRDPASRKSASFSSGKEVCKFITELGISKVGLYYRGAFITAYKLSPKLA